MTDRKADGTSKTMSCMFYIYKRGETDREVLYTKRKIGSIKFINHN